jgi:hypothetical protein
MVSIRASCAFEYLVFSAQAETNRLAPRVNSKFVWDFVQGFELGIRFRIDVGEHKKRRNQWLRRFL